MREIRAAMDAVKSVPEIARDRFAVSSKTARPILQFATLQRNCIPIAAFAFLFKKRKTSENYLFYGIAKMKIKKEKLKSLVQSGALREIFTDHLGWDLATGEFKTPFSFGGEQFKTTVSRIAQKRGFVVCTAPYDSRLQDKAARQRLQKELSRFHYEHLLVLRDDSGAQVWMIAVKRPDKPIRIVEVSLAAGQSPDFLLEKLYGLLFTLADEKRFNRRRCRWQSGGSFCTQRAKNHAQLLRPIPDELYKFQEFVKDSANR